MTVQELRTQVILLGASNLVLGWTQLIRQIHTVVAGPMNIFAACGMGRSYVSWSRFGARRLPSIQDCGLWNQLGHTSGAIRHSTELIASSSEVPVRVLLTDVGNDLVYGRSPDEIITAIRRSLSRILDCFPQSRIVVTELPLDSIRNLEAFRFNLTRSLLFAGCRLTLPQVQSLATELNDKLVELRHDFGFAIAQPKPQWYGFDPIHVRRCYRDEAFASYLDAWQNTPATTLMNSNGSHHPRLPRPTPELRQVWGRERLVTQPTVSTQQFQLFGY